MSAIDLEELKVRATRAHRVSCSDPDDLTRETPYSVQLKLVAALEAVQALHKPVEGCFSYTVCSTCFTEAEEIPEDYPCPTLKTIEEALS